MSIFKDKSGSNTRDEAEKAVQTYMEPRDEPWLVFPSMDAGKNYPKHVRNLPPVNRGKHY